MGSNKIVVASICSLLLVAMIVGLVYTGQKQDHEDSDLASSQKAVTTLCQNTDYKDVCVESLASDKETADPIELIERGFKAAMAQIKEAAHNSSLLESLENDPRGKSALESCQELADRAVNDLQRSLDKFKEFDWMNLDVFLSDMKIWLSGAVTYQETCLDGFQGVEGDDGQKMREYLTKGMQMTSNGLAMVNEISSTFQPGTTSASDIASEIAAEITSDSSSRRLSESTIPDWVDSNRRSLKHASPKAIKPDLVVAKDGSGNFTTINEALEHVPTKRNTTFVLYIKEGVYEEKVTINSSLTYLVMVGDGPTKTKITGSLNFIDGVTTYRTATVAIHADSFTAKDIGFENSAGAEKHQAVALRVSADLAIFYNCQMDGYQDTLYAHTYRQFYKDCVISGTIDFIFGDSAAIFQGCTMVVRKPLSNQDCIVTAQGRKDVRQPTGLVLQNCSFVADPEYYPVRYTNKAYLGRPWKEFSRTIIMESFLDDLIQPEGWLPWNGDYALNTLFYTEFNNRGPAASKVNRVKWFGVKELPSKRILRFTGNRFIDGKQWVPARNITYDGGFIFKRPTTDPKANYSEVGPEENIAELMRHKSAYIATDTIAAPPELSYFAPSPSPIAAAAPAPTPVVSHEQPKPYAAAAPAPTPVVSHEQPKPYAAPVPAPTPVVSHEQPKLNKIPAVPRGLPKIPALPHDLPKLPALPQDLPKIPEVSDEEPKPHKIDLFGINIELPL